MVKNLEKQVGVRINSDLLRKVEEHAKKESRSVGAVIRLAIEKYLRGVKK